MGGRVIHAKRSCASGTYFSVSKRIAATQHQRSILICRRKNISQLYISSRYLLDIFVISAGLFYAKVAVTFTGSVTAKVAHAGYIYFDALNIMQAARRRIEAAREAMPHAR